MNKLRHIKTDAIILKTSASGEINRNFIFISPIIGVQNATAFGAAKHSSRFCASVQPYIVANLNLYKSEKLNYLKLEDISNVILNDFINNKLEYIYLTSFFTDILLNSYISSDEFKSYFYLLFYSISILKEQNDIYKSFLFFTSKFLFLSGYKFNLMKCSHCGCKFDRYYFDINNGGVFCENDAVSKKFFIDFKSCSLWENFYIGKYMDLKSEIIDLNCIKQIYPITVNIIKNIFEKQLVTLNFLDEIFNK